jgi:hypothetical protein
MLIAPGTQAIIGGYGWLVALVATAALGLLALPLSRVFGSSADAVAVGMPRPRDSADLRDVLRAPSFWLTAGSFGVCGFHVAYLTTHMPGVIERCGLDPSLLSSLSRTRRLGFSSIAISMYPSSSFS